MGRSYNEHRVRLRAGRNYDGFAGGRCARARSVRSVADLHVDLNPPSAAAAAAVVDDERTSYDVDRDL